MKGYENRYRPLLHTEEELALIFSLHYTRKLSKNLSCQFQNTEYQLQGYGNGYRLRGAQVTLCQSFAGEVTILHQGKELAYQRLSQGQRPTPIDDEKTVGARVDQVRRQQQQKPHWKPAVDHPWKRSFKASLASGSP